MKNGTTRVALACAAPLLLLWAATASGAGGDETSGPSEQAGASGAGGADAAGGAPGGAEPSRLSDRACEGGAGGDAAARAGPPVHAPVPRAPIQPAYPAAAEAARAEGDVALILTIDAGGAVTDVQVEASPNPALTEAAVAAARTAAFHPATDAEGHPTSIRVRWLMHFTLPEKRTPVVPTSPTPAPASGAAHGSVETFDVGAAATLSIHVRERGTGKDLPEATVFLEDVGERLHLDPRARVERRLGAGAVVVVVRAPGHHQQEFIERLHPGERVERTYFVEKERLNEYETVIHARPRRAESGVVTLEADEIHNIPGTFGDPFRTAMLMPGVGSMLSGIGYPVIRGEAPGQTGTFIDDVRVPLLYHVGFGPAVVHPLFLESLDFHPGNFPAEFGRFSGALIHAHSTPAATEPQTMLSADLFKLSAFHARPFTVGEHEGAIAVAARYGTFAFLARAIDPSAVLEYWDYQLRGDLQIGGGALRVLLFGAQDTTGNRADPAHYRTVDDLLEIGFHRLAVGYRATWSGTQVDAGLELGRDATTSSGNPEVMPPDPPLRLHELVARARLKLTRRFFGERVKLSAGADPLAQSWEVNVTSTSIDRTFAGDVFPRSGLSPGAFVQAELQPTEGWLVSPGVRVDHYRFSYVGLDLAQTSVDPRIASRVQLRPGLFVKGGFGVYSSPPRFLLPWPGLPPIGIERGLNHSYQSTLGAELILPFDMSVDGQVYFNWIPRLTEFSFAQSYAGNLDNTLDQTTYPGRAYGLELIARRRLGHRLFGWLTYTYAHAERKDQRVGWRPADFDQPHLVNAVLSYALGRSWTVAGVFHYNSGRPYTPSPPGDSSIVAATYSARLPDFWRVDLRIEKREAFDTWFLDFYIDWLNISLQREATSWNDRTMSPDTVLLTIPTFGLQAQF